MASEWKVPVLITNPMGKTSPRATPFRHLPRRVVGPESSVGVYGTEGDHAAHDDTGVAGICGQESPI